MKLTVKRYEVLKRLKGGKLLKWRDNAWAGQGSAWWVEGSADTLHIATCHWLVRNKLVEYDEAYNDVDGGTRDDRNEWGVLAYRITAEGAAALKVNGPKSIVLKFKQRAA